MANPDFSVVDATWSSVGMTTITHAAIYKAEVYRDWRWLWLRKRERTTLLGMTPITLEPGDYTFVSDPGQGTNG